MGEIRPLLGGYRGMTIQDSVYRDGNIAYSHNLECRDGDTGITLFNKPQKIFDTNEKILHIVENDEGNVFFFASDGKVYDETGTQTVDFGIEPLAVNFYDEKFIVIYRDGNNLKFACVDDDGTSNKNMSYMANGDFNMGKSWDYIPTLNISDTHLYVGARRRVLRVSPEGSNGFFEESMKFERNIKGLVPSGNGIVVVLENGACYFWDGFSETYSNNYNNSVHVRYIFSNTGTIFVVGGVNYLYTELYVLNGLRFELIRTYKRTEGIETHDKFDIRLPNRISDNFNAYNRNLHYTLSKGKIMTFGESEVGLPFGYINTNSSNENDVDIDTVHSLYKKNKGTQLYACFETDGGDVSIENILGTHKYVSKGVVYYPLMRFGPNEKRISSVFARYANVTGQTYIDIYYSLDGGPYQLLHSLNNKQDVYKRESLFDMIKVDLVQNTYFSIQFKVVLRTDNEDHTPNFFGLYFDEENNAR